MFKFNLHVLYWKNEKTHVIHKFQFCLKKNIPSIFVCFFVWLLRPHPAYSRGLCPPGFFPQFWLNQNRCAALTTWLEGSREDRCLKGRSPRGGYRGTQKNKGFGFVGCFLGWLLGKKTMAIIFKGIFFCWFSLGGEYLKVDVSDSSSRMWIEDTWIRGFLAGIVLSCGVNMFQPSLHGHSPKQPRISRKKTGYLYVFIKHKYNIYIYNQKYIFRHQSHIK